MILKGDCIEVMKAIKLNSVDAIVCDPPYGLEFMGKQWDKLGKINSGRSRAENEITAISRGPETYKAGIEAQLWHTQWLTEAYRVLKPGGSMLVMGGTRTSHRLACAIEDTGFIIKDTIMFMYGSGFPKCQDITPMIDGKVLGITTKQVKERREKIGKNPNDRKKRENTLSNYGLQGGVGKADITKSLTPEAKHWDGFKVGGIKPAYEPIVWAVKPPGGSYVDNILKWGVGAVNVDECRVNHNGQDGVYGSSNKSCKPTFCDSETVHDFRSEKHNKGRFPANVILSHHPECVDDCHPDCAVRLLDEQSGNLQSGANPERRNSAKTKTCYGEFEGQKNCISHRGKDNGGASRFFYCAKASRGERNAGLEGMEEKFMLDHEEDLESKHGYKTKGDNTGKAELLYSQINKHKTKNANNHPTVKPIRLFEWLIKLVSRQGQIILDPFLGSGTTSIAAHNTGRKCIGIEKEDEYLEIAKRRISYWQNQPKQNSLNLGE